MRSWQRITAVLRGEGSGVSPPGGRHSLSRGHGPGDQPSAAGRPGMAGHTGHTPGHTPGHAPANTPGHAAAQAGGGAHGAAARAALLYAAFGAAWILWSDTALFRLAEDVPAMAVLSRWKGLLFVLLSAALVYLLARRSRAAASAAVALPAPGADARLIVVSGVAALAILGTGVAGAVSAARAEREEVIGLLRTVVELKSGHWERWLWERQHQARFLGRDPELLLLVQQRAAGQDGGASADVLRRVCERGDCIGARLHWRDGSSLPANGGPAADHVERALRTSSAEFADAVAGDSAAASIELAVPVAAAPGSAPAAPAVLVLRFDASAAIAELLEPAGRAFAPMQVLLSRREDASQVVLHGGTGDGSASTLRRFTPAATSSWPVDLPAGGGARTFGASGDDGTEVVGVASRPRSLGWTLSAHVAAQHLLQRAWGAIGWIVVAALAALAGATVAAFGLHQRRELAFARREHAQQQLRLQTAGLLDAIANGTPDVIYAKDLQGRYLFANAAACRALGRPVGEVIGRDSSAFLSAADAARVAALDAEVMACGEVRCSEGELATAEGRRDYLHTIGPLRDAAGRLTGTFGILHDVTERRRQELRHRQWAKAFESTRDGVMICDARGRIESINPAFTEITGYALDEIVGRTPALLHSGRQDRAFYRAQWACLKAAGHWRGEIWNRRRSGEVYPEWLTIHAVRSEAGEVSNYVGVFTDITRVKEDEARLERLANFDPLTERPNRRLMLSRLQQALAQGQRHGRRTALLYIDLDGFKTVNDSLGHPAGDELLVCIAQRLGDRLREGDTLGRLGGDEFLVLVESVPHPEDVATLARDLLAAVAQPVMLSGGREAYVTASIGISLHPEDGASGATELLRDADAAMYRAKELGRNCFSFYTQELNAQAISKLDTEAALSRAAERGELLLHYQPKVEAANGRISGAEALLRWQRDGELVPPCRFIPLAEASSLILHIGEWVIDQACGQIRRWREAGLEMPCIAVNVAARQFAAGNLDQVVREALQRHGVPADRLELELTESMLVEQPERGIALLGRLRDIGVKLSLDDFGTGYSSLAYLRQFPIDSLKIDKSFVDEIGRGPNGTAIVDAVIELAHRLHLTVVAEGVETDAQQDHLRQRGCDVLQGYRVGRPMGADAFEARWRAQSSTATGVAGGLAAPAGTTVPESAEPGA